MLKKIIWFIVVCGIASTSWSIPPKTVYRPDMSTPDEIKAKLCRDKCEMPRRPGFYPEGMVDGRVPPVDISLLAHVGYPYPSPDRSGYVFTTASRGTAVEMVRDHLNNRGYVYHIHATPNFVDVNNSLLRFSPRPSELEFASLGPIYWSQVVGWERIQGASIGEFVPNPDYRATLYGEMTTSGGQPQLAGFPVDDERWNEVPWNEFANCQRQQCVPISDAQKAGEEFYTKTSKRIDSLFFEVLFDDENISSYGHDEL